MFPEGWDAHSFSSVTGERQLLSIYEPLDDSLRSSRVAKLKLLSNRLFVEYLIPVYNSYSALRLKKKNAILSLLQYWLAFPIAISVRSVVFLAEALFHVVSPVFDELYILGIPTHPLVSSTLF